jgi:ribosomal protein L29
MAKDKKILSEKEIVKRIRDLKIELLKSPTKRGRVKKEIARLLTMAKLGNKPSMMENGKIGVSKAEIKSGGTKA